MPQQPLLQLLLQLRMHSLLSVMTAPLRYFGVIYTIVAAATPTAFAANLIWCNTTQGYSSEVTGTLEVLPSNTVRQTRSDLECAAKCLLQQPSCLQIYYNFTTGMCYFMSSLSRLTLTNSTGGALIATPNDLFGDQCGTPKCAVCVRDCSTQFGGPMCLLDNTYCPHTPELVNVRHYYLSTYEDDKDVGVVQAVNYIKLSNDTAMRVRWYATIRTFENSSSYCARYFVTFNGRECTNSTAIEFFVYDEFGAEHQKFSEIDGLCYGILAGSVTVAINVGSCAGYPPCNSFTGWHSSRSIWIWEVKPMLTKGSISCGGLTYYNTQQSVTKGLKIVETVNSANPDVELTSMFYTKISNTTYIGIKWTATTSVYSPVNSTYCAKWYATVNGIQCPHKVELMTAMLDSTFNSARINSRTRTMEGFCAGFLAGTYRIAIMVGPCFGDSAQPNTTTTCCSNASQLIVTEERFSQRLQAVRTPTGSYVILPFFNLVYWSWPLLNSLVSSGAVTYSTYGKWSNISALHMRAVGNTRVLAAGGCCRWYFTIDGNECSQPGPIEAVQYTGRSVNYYSHGIVDGVCYGYPAGTHNLRLNVGKCPGYAVSTCASGGNITFQVYVEEIHFEGAATCLDPLACP